MMHNDCRHAELEIRNRCPEFIVESIEPLGEGFRNKAFLVNGEWVFRFPKDQEGAADLAKEIQLLPLLAPRLRISIPGIQYVGEQTDGGSFVGYRKVPGQLIGEHDLPSLPRGVRDRLARRLAGFLDALRAFPADAAVRAGVPVRSTRDEAAALRETAGRQAFPKLEEGMRTYLDGRFRQFLEHPEYHVYIPSLIHGDLSPDHLLLDEETGELAGVIDFGDAAVSDPDCDYLYLLEDGGEPFVRQIMAHRDVVNPEERIRKVSYFVTFDQVCYLLEGLQSGDEARIAEGLEALEADRRANE